VPDNNDSRLPKSVSWKAEERSSIRVKKKVLMMISCRWFFSLIACDFLLHHLQEAIDSSHHITSHHITDFHSVSHERNKFASSTTNFELQNTFCNIII
jgi:hypothetical protein